MEMLKVVPQLALTPQASCTNVTYFTFDVFVPALTSRVIKERTHSENRQIGIKVLHDSCLGAEYTCTIGEET